MGTFTSNFKIRAFALLTLFTVLANVATAQVLYTSTPLTGQTYTTIPAGTVVNTAAQLTGGSLTQDDSYVLVTLPFTFTYNGTTFTDVTMCTNGWLGMGNQTAVTALNSRTPGNFFSTVTPNNIIAAWFRDMGGNFPGVGSMIHGSIGTDVYAFEWNNAVGTGFSVTTANLINFQVILYGPASTNPGRIEILYGSTTGTVAFATAIGLEDAVGGPNRFLNALNNSTTSTATSTAWPGNGNGWRFDPVAPTTTSNFAIAPVGNQCAATARTVSIDLANTTGIQSAVINWSINGVAQTPATMTLSAGTATSGTWTGTIPPASGGGVYNVTYSISATLVGGAVYPGSLQSGSYIDNFVGTYAGPDVVLGQGLTTTLNASANDPSLFPVVISEIVQFETGTGFTNPYPAYMNVTAYDLDGIEISNIGTTAVNIGGLIVNAFTGAGPTVYTYTIPANTILPAGSVATVVWNTAAVSSPANFFFASAVGFSPGSTTLAGYTIRTSTGTILDAVATNSYVFPASTGVTAADWSGNIASTSGLGGARRTGATDTNLSTDWTVSSAANVQNYGSYNTQILPVAPSGGTFTWTPGGATTQSISVGPLAPGVYTYSVSYTLSGCTSTDALQITVPNCPAPTNVTVANVTDTSALISWTSGGGAVDTTYIDFGPVGHAAGTGTIITLVGASGSFTISPLTPQTSYIAYVQESCDPTAGNSFWSAPSATFTTPCSPFPYPGNGQANAIPVATYPFTSTVNTATCFGDNSPLRVGRDVFYTFTADSCASSITVSLCGSSFDTYLYIRDATNTTTIALNDDFCGLQSQITFTPTGGATYYAILEPFSSGGTGTYVVNITQTLGTPGTTVNPTVTNTTCPSGPNSTNGSITLTLGGSTKSPITYAWSTTDVTPSLSNLAPGTYSVTVTNGCGGTGVATADVESNFNASIATTDITCFGANDGAIDLTYTGGVAPFNFLWTNLATTEDISGLSPGFYGVGLTTGDGCVLAFTDTVYEPEILNVTIDSTFNVNCFGDSTASIYVTTTGGTPVSSDTLTTTFLSNNGSGGNFFDVNVLNNLTVTGFEVNLSAAAGTPVTVGVYYRSGTFVGNTGSAAGWTFAGAFNATAGGNNLPTSVTMPTGIALPTGISAFYLYKADAGVYNWNYQNGVAVGNLFASDANLEIFEGNGIADAAPFTGLVFSPRNFTGSIIYSIASSNGGGYTYLWSNGSTESDLLNIPIGTYTLAVSDGNGCQFTTPDVTITEPTLLTLTKDTLVHVSCNGDSTGYINLTTGGGVTPYTYLWTNGDTMEDADSLVAGIYSVLLTDSNGCTVALGPDTINEPTPLTMTLDTIIDNICFGANQGFIYITPSGATAPYTFFWSDSSTNEDILYGMSMNYFVTITDSLGCTLYQGPYFIDQPTQITPIIDSINHLDCNGDVDGGIYLSTTGGTGALSFVWSNSEFTEDISNLPGGPYTVTVSDAAGCTRVAGPITVIEPAPLTQIGIVPVNITCFGLNNGGVDLTIGGGTTPYGFNWNNAATTEDLTNLSAGSYITTVTDANGCVFVAGPAVITEPADLISAIASSSNVACLNDNNGTIDVSVSGGTLPYSYNWSNAATTQDVSGLPGGAYAVTITDGSGCTDVLNTTINAPATQLVVNSVVVDMTASNQLGSITVNPTGGVPPYQYLWSTGQTGNPISNMPTSIYTVTVVDANGCAVTVQDTVEFISGITNTGIEFGLNMFPNPTSDLLNINVKMNGSEKVNIEIFNGAGQIVTELSQVVNNEAMLTVDLSNQAAGLYIARVTVGGMQVSKRVSVTH
jgi:hypothetical protein